MLVVWEPVIRTDIAPPTNGTLARIADARAIQYGDHDRTFSAYLTGVARANPGWVRPQDRARLGREDFVAWDVALVFPAGSRWEATLPAPSFYGGPIIDELDRLRAAIRS